MKFRLFVIYFLLFVITGCSYNVPLRHKLVINNPPNPKYNKKILVIMPRQQAQKVIRHSPQPGDTYVFAGGPALKDMLVNVLGQLFKEVAYSESRDKANSNYDLAVDVNFRSYDITLNIYTGNVVKLGIDYTLLDKKGKVLKKIPTNTSSKDKYSGSDLAKTFLVGAFFNIGKMKKSSGAAWDKATINSLGHLIDNLIKIAKR